MKKTLTLLMLAASMTATLIGCAGQSETAQSPASTKEETSAPETEATSNPETTAKTDDSEQPVIQVGSLKGPTSMGLVYLMEQDAQNNSAQDYEFTMVTAADELLGTMVSGKLDIALLPANVASILYNKTSGAISVIDINTLGVLYLVASDDSISSMADLKGKTLYLTGKGTTPDYVLHYLMSANGMTESDIKLEYKSEATEVAAILKEQAGAIGLLPQPFVTAACAQNEALRIVLDLTKEWDELQGESGSRLVTGVTVVRNAFLEQYPKAVNTFLEEHLESAVFTENQPDKAAQLIAAAGIIEKAPVAEKALPYCNITCITGQEMKDALSGYLQVLAEQNPSSVGGTIPGDAFYYVP